MRRRARASELPARALAESPTTPSRRSSPLGSQFASRRQYLEELLLYDSWRPCGTAAMAATGRREVDLCGRRMLERQLRLDGVRDGGY
ncbi:hypothetical protein GUJ93_ZPchr1001g40576 [Zizania palustris]|uniref:Uncharacterized protein n=1 Tax=Zizania palustris TaxID=103762 RepID=A0A8J5UVB7_ZIZPA|nr:hypothetical protein GUJ93_ZPchr1001g40576 [Zizania palustris]